ncbi:cAMP receptor protein [compost metagenome]
MRNLAHMSVKARISQAFISLKDQFGLDDNGCIDIEMSRQDISSFAGTTYETLFKVLNDFAKLNVLTITGRKIRILDEYKLSQIVSDDNA